MAPLSSLPVELTAAVAEHLQPLPRASFFKALRSRWFPKPLVSATKIWDLVFKNDEWVNRVLQIKGACNRDPTVSLIGKDLEKLYHGRSTKDTYLVLAIHDWTGDTVYFQDEFFKSLHEHRYNKERSEIKLTNSGITLHIGDAVKSDEWVDMSDPSRMFRLTKGKLSTKAIYYTDNVLYDIGPELIGGIREISAKNAVRHICAIKLKFRDGTPLYRVFINYSKSVRVVHIWGTDERGSEWITQWRLAQPNEREWHA